MDARQERGLQIAALAKIQKNRLGWQVPSQSGNGSYVVSVEGEPFCTCPDFTERQQPCKHVYAVQYVIQRECNPDGSTTYKESIQVSRQWTVYNEAQTNEGTHFVALLKELCEGIQQPAQKMGRPRLPISDVLFGEVYKVYCLMSGRRFMTDLNEAQEQGLVAKAAHYNSISRYMENPEITTVLKAMIEESASPLRSVETNFAVDSSGFATTTYNRWFDHKWGKMKSEAKWVKAHLMCGVDTHIVTSVEVTPTETADAPQLPTLVKSTADTFEVKEVSADKAYSSRKNLRAIQAVGGVAYIPFKNRTTGMGKSFDGLWNRMWHYYAFNRSTFLEHYHKRSNVETVFSMVKAKFGASVRAKTPVAQVNEVLCKILAHNLCVLIQSMYELGIDPTFRSKVAVAPKVTALVDF